MLNTLLKQILSAPILKPRTVYSVSKLELQYFFPGVYFVSFDYICHNFCQHQADSDNLFKIITFVIKKNVQEL
jgi:hypothetical protein